MADRNAADKNPARPRTATRARGVAPPGFDEVKPLEGRKTIGRYEILEVLGKGAMGVVYKGRDPLLDRIVAIKTIVSPRSAGKRTKSAYLERFQREAKAAARMQHPAIVTIFDVGLEEDAPFMVLEFLPGESLADRLDRVRMPLLRIIQIARDLASALGFAHKERIVHRDVKPANVLCAGDSRWKLADFGIARMPDSDLTQAGIFMGTPGYAPPEAIREGRYTPQADVFAWGAVLYEMLCGRIAYEGPDTQTTNGFVLRATAPSPRHHDPSVPEPLAEVAMRALAPDTARRYKDGVEAEAALARAWDLCLKSGLVTPAALAGDELPHERAGHTMHGPPLPGSPVGSAAPTTEQSGGSVPVVIKRPPPPPPVSDDDATSVHVRNIPPAPGARDVSAPATIRDPSLFEPAPPTAPGERPLGVDTRQETAIIDPARAAEVIADGSSPHRMEPRPAPPPNVWLWVTLVLVAVFGSAIGVFYWWHR